MLGQNTSKDDNRYDTVTDKEDNGDHLSDLADDRQSAVVVPPHRLEKALDAVLQMEKLANGKRLAELLRAE